MGDTNPKQSVKHLIHATFNIRRSHEWRLTADYSWSKDWFRMYLVGALKKPYIKFPYLEGTKINDRISRELQTRFTFNLYKSLSFYTNIS